MTPTLADPKTRRLISVLNELCTKSRNGYHVMVPGVRGTRICSFYGCGRRISDGEWTMWVRDRERRAAEQLGWQR